MLPLPSTIRPRSLAEARISATLPPLSSSASIKALFASPPSALALPAGNPERIALSGQVPLTDGEVFHRVALDG
jgi:hypothetical protein